MHIASSLLDNAEGIDFPASLCIALYLSVKRTTESGWMQNVSEIS